MKDRFYKNLIPLLIRNFIPASPFYTNFLVEAKDFSNNEVSNLIAPFYFFFSFIAVFIYKQILNNIGIEYSAVLISAVYFINMIIFLNIRKRSLFASRLVYSISGFISTFDVFIRFYIGESNQKKQGTDTKCSYLGVRRALVGAFSSCVGEEIVKRTGHYEINIIISIFTQFIGFIISLYTAMNKKEQNTFREIELGYLDILKKLDKTMICAFLAGSICNCFNLFTKLFVNNIVRDRIEKTTTEHHSIKESFDNSNNKTNDIVDGVTKHNPFYIFFTKYVTNALYLPVSIMSSFLIFIVTRIFKKYSSAGSANIKYLGGNANAISSVLCYQITYFITVISDSEYKERIYISSFILAAISLLAMSKSRNKILIYSMYLSTELFSKTCNSVAKLFLTNPEVGGNLVIYCFTSELILHVLINQICKIFKVNVISKARVYGYVGIGIFLLIMTIKSTS